MKSLMKIKLLVLLLVLPSLEAQESRIGPDQFQLEAIEGSEARTAITDGPDNQPAIMVAVAKLGEEFWSVELRAPGIAIEAGKNYELKFQARSAPSRYVYVVPEKTDGNQSSLAEGTILQISEDWAECTVLFHAADSSTSGRLTLSSLSAVPASYWFSSFRLTEK
jgi:hypothetical protein